MLCDTYVLHITALYFRAYNHNSLHEKMKVFIILLLKKTTFDLTWSILLI